MTQVLYAAKGGSSASDLYTIDPATGDETSVGASGIAITGLASHPDTGVLYAVSTPSISSGARRRLYTVDTTTGLATLVGPVLTANAVIPDVAFDADGVLWGWQSAGTMTTLDLVTGAQTTGVYGGAPPISGGGLSINSSGVAYTAISGNPQHLNIVDLATATITTDVGEMTAIGSANISAFAFDADDVLWGIALDSGTASLVTVNTSTAAATVIGAMAANMDALAWGVAGGGPPPPPATIEGVSFAFTDSALEPSPTWTRIDL